MKVLNKIAALGLVALLASCGSSSSEGEGLSGKVSIDGSSTVYPITAGIAEYYGEENDNVEVLVGVSGTGGGFKKFCIGQTDINDASRPIKDKEIAVAEENNITYQQLSVAYDGIAVVINPANDWVDHITTEELQNIWKSDAGADLKWSDIREGWPEEKIQLYGPGDASGTYDYFNEAILGKELSCRNDYNASENDNMLVKGVADDKYALGYFGLAYYEENKETLKVAPVKDGENAPVTPSLTTVMDKSYSPLSRPIFIYVSSEAIKKAQVKSFVEFYLENAAEVSKKVGYIPMTEEEYTAQKDIFQSFCK